jgi:hypothetical protein
MLLFLSDRQHPSQVALFGTDTVAELSTVATICARKLDSDHLIVVAIFTCRPARAGFTFWARRPMLLPIKLKLSGSKTGLLTRLPPIVQPRWPK